MTSTRKKWKPHFPSWTPEWIKLIWKIGVRLSLIFLVIFILLASFYWILASQYDLKEVTKITEKNLILYDDGKEFTALSGDHSRLITREEINQHTFNALIAREDTRFREHHGIDLRGLARATWRNLKSMSYKEGASTISMQLVKNTYDNKSKSIHRKLLEIAITFRLEAEYDKDEILTHYLNRIYFGAGAHGIEDAAHTYFNTTTKDLTLGQSALLVGIIRGPSIFSPFKEGNLDTALAQRDQVLDRMLELKFITAEEAAESKSANLHLSPRALRRRTNNYAVRSIDRHLQQIIDDQEITEGGLKIRSTINKQKLNKITLDIKRILPAEAPDDENPLQIAAILLENKTGAIKAIIGGRNFLNSPYNRALDSKQELGTALYPFLYVTAYERGKLPIKDNPTITGKLIGRADFLAFCKRFGITYKPADEANDLYRGSIYASPLQLATAYATLRTEGKRVESYLIESLKNQSDTTLFSHSHYEKSVAKPGNIDSALQMIHSGNQTFTLTASPYKHHWIITSSPTHTAITWLGHDSPKAISGLEGISKKLQAAMPAWLE